MMKKLLLALFVAFSLAQPASAAEPLTWLKGGYGPSIRQHGIAPCPSPQVHQPKCPPGATQIMSVSAWPASQDIYEVFEGDAKWYWEPIPVRRAYPTKGTYRLTFDYQPYTWGAEATAWYQLADGSNRYERLTKLEQKTFGSMGYQPWEKADILFTVPADVEKFTVFLSTTGRLDCSGTEVASLCKNPSHRTLNLANVVLEDGTGITRTESEVLAQIAALEAEIARLQKLLAELKNRM